ncbi:RND family efflux transporter MFP subunit [Alkalispirillum mobile]|uniref:RND family efflux transporter MFP subunit n=1 Tax=Alkalispirillum mobile TaxID=85925 RepID=A0A498C5R4_9GAMM|nr:efflux RND transporter periplasmic adaptor subunit [Alkalispirillum mobile]RLK50992.1 RND family efflux transporter MFP subunit [Alkalispirillum mobile]
MRRNRFLLTRLPVLLALGLALLLVGCDDAPEADHSDLPRPVYVEPARLQPALELVTLPGQLRAHDESPLAFRVSGPVDELPLSEGDRVSAGDLLARMDPRDYQRRVDGLKEALAEAEAARSLAETEKRRLRRAAEGPGVTELQLDQARAALAQASARVERTRQELESARDNLQDTRLQAPTDGVLAQRMVEPGQMVEAGQPVVLFQNTDSLDVTVDIPERLLVGGALTGPLQVRLPMLGEALHRARLVHRASTPSPATGTWRIRLRLDEPPDGASPGMRARVLLQPAIDEDSVWLMPMGALDDREDEPRVWRLREDDTLEPVPVTVLGLQADRLQLAAEALNVGDRVVSVGAVFLREGQRVTPLEVEASR